MQMLSFLEGFELNKEEPISVERLHRMIDAQNVAFADRNKYLGDADFVKVPVKGLLDKSYLRHRRSSLSLPFEAIQTPVPPGSPPGSTRDFARVVVDEERGTTHWSVVDRHGNAASVTSTIEENLGAALVVPGRGFLLNNELTDFESFETDSDGIPYANAPEGGKLPRRTALGQDASSLGGKRPRSSMTPTLIFNSTVGGERALYLAVGSPGGSSITGAVLNVILNVADHGLDLQEATDLARVLGKNGETSAETGIYEAEGGGVLAGLQARGFNFSSPVPTTATYGRVETILVGQDGFLYGAADVLREPQALADGF
jgi:gamma-glutamyltranspeptidase/glutathione hydrolase